MSTMNATALEAVLRLFIPVVLAALGLENFES